jgi:hypothetical protein
LRSVTVDLPGVERLHELDHAGADDLAGTGIRKPSGYGVTNMADAMSWPVSARRGSRARGKAVALVPAGDGVFEG